MFYEPVMKNYFICLFLKIKFNLFPCYRSTGARCIFISTTLQEVHIKLPLNWRTRGYFSTLFGGSIYASIDPVYMVMLNLLLGDGYAAWDKSASIRFRKPGKTTLYSIFKISDQELMDIKNILKSEEKVDRLYQVRLCDKDGVVYAECEKVIQIRRK